MHHPFLFDANSAQLEEFLLLGLFVAGKNGVIQQQKLNWFLTLIGSAPWDNVTPFSKLAALPKEKVSQLLIKVGAGQYTKLNNAISWLVQRHIDLRQCSREELCECPGIGLKTASFFLIYTRKHCSYACLDTHILRWLREECGYSNAPHTSPPTLAKYIQWEKVYLEEAARLNKNPTELDFEIWLNYSTMRKSKVSL